MIFSSGSIGNVLGGIIGYGILFLIIWVSTEKRKPRKKGDPKLNYLNIIIKILIVLMILGIIYMAQSMFFG